MSRRNFHRGMAVMAAAIGDDHATAFVARMSLAHRGSGGATYPGANHGALTPPEFVTEHGTRGPANRASNCRVTAIVEIRAPGE